MRRWEPRRWWQGEQQRQSQKSNARNFASVCSGFPNVTGLRRRSAGRGWRFCRKGRRAVALIKTDLEERFHIARVERSLARKVEARRDGRDVEVGVAALCYDISAVDHQTGVDGYGHADRLGQDRRRKAVDDFEVPLQAAIHHDEKLRGGQPIVPRTAIKDRRGNKECPPRPPFHMHFLNRLPPASTSISTGGKPPGM